MKRNCLKLIAVVAAAVFAGTAAWAQTGIHAGYMNSVNSIKMNSEKYKLTTNGFYVGVDQDIHLVAGLSIQPGLYYSYLVDKTDKSTKEIGNLKMTSYYEDHHLNVPVHLKYGFDVLPDMLKIYVFAGPTFDVGLLARQKYNVSGSLLGKDIDGKLTYNYYTGKVRTNLDDDAQNSINPADQESRYSRFDLLLGGGVGVEALGFLDVKVGYDYGVVNKLKGDAAKAGSVNRGQFYAGIGIRF